MWGKKIRNREVKLESLDSKKQASKKPLISLQKEEKDLSFYVSISDALFACLSVLHQAWDPRFDQSQSGFASSSLYQ